MRLVNLTEINEGKKYDLFVNLEEINSIESFHTKEDNTEKDEVYKMVLKSGLAYEIDKDSVEYLYKVYHN